MSFRNCTSQTHTHVVTLQNKKQDNRDEYLPWKGNQLLDLCITRCGSDMPLVKSQLGMVFKLLGAVSENPGNVSCGGVGIDVLKFSDKMPSIKIWFAVCLQYPRVASRECIERTKLRCGGSNWHVCAAEVVEAPNFRLFGFQMVPKYPVFKQRFSKNCCKVNFLRKRNFHRKLFLGCSSTSFGCR